MQERNDGSFSEIQEPSELLQKLLGDRDEMLRTKAIHIGSIKELEDIRKGKDTYTPIENDVELEDLKKRIEVLEKKEKSVSDFIYIPTDSEIDFHVEHRRKFLNRYHK